MIKVDIFEDYLNRVKDMKNKYSWNIDINDDDSMSDFISSIDLNSMQRNELSILLFYNIMIQSNAFNPIGDCKFYVEVPTF